MSAALKLPYQTSSASWSPRDVVGFATDTSSAYRYTYVEQVRVGIEIATPEDVADIRAADIAFSEAQVKGTLSWDDALKDLGL